MHNGILQVGYRKGKEGIKWHLVRFYRISYTMRRWNVERGFCRSSFLRGLVLERGGGNGIQ